MRVVWVSGFLHRTICSHSSSCSLWSGSKWMKEIIVSVIIYIPPHNSLAIVEESRRSGSLLCFVGYGIYWDILFLWVFRTFGSLWRLHLCLMRWIRSLVILSRHRYFLWSIACEYFLRLAFESSPCASMVLPWVLWVFYQKFISLGFFTSIAKYRPSIHPIISEIPGFAKADFRFWYIPFFGLYRHSEIILSTFAHLSMRNSRMSASICSSDCSSFIFIKIIPDHHHVNLRLCLLRDRRSIFILPKKSNLVAVEWENYIVFCVDCKSTSSA